MLTKDIIAKQLDNVLDKTDLNLGPDAKKYEGKVRDNYTIGDKRVIITTDRISAFDRVLGTIPFKGEILTRIARFWFDNTKDIIQNHIIEYPDPNAMVVHECKPLPVEMIIRGYITGVTTTSAWYNYSEGKRLFCGNQLPEGLKKDQEFDKPIITPTTKAEHGAHDENLSGEEIISQGLVDAELYKQMEEITFKLFERGTELAAKNGLILVDTKYEFGLYNGKLMLMDEIHTPDSSRFWVASEYEERFATGAKQKNLDKEYIREWMAEKGFRGDGEMPPLTDEVRVELATKYMEVFETITGDVFDSQPEDVSARIETNLLKFKQA
ncbi:phosphoribosylaminoimidazolesuccinocarboxamide synthase [Candidatus Woesearchaeota archaeon]|nr:phosphoribosylaminoimidazolesuccinocarboxamide synthase [Candidatus Woesearchaeota archaeon]